MFFYVILHLFISFRLTTAAVGDKLHEPTIIELTDATFGNTVAEGSPPWLVLVYAGNSTFAATSLENFKIAAELLNLIYKFGYVDYIKNPVTAATFKMITYDDAALFIFGDDRTNPIVKLQAGISWETSHFINEGLQGLHQILEWRLEDFKVENRPKKKPQELKPDNFLAEVSKQEANGTYSPWIVLFYSDENSESQRIKAIYEIATAELYPKVKTGLLDVNKHYKFASGYFDNMFVPTIMYIGKRSTSSVYPNPILPMAQRPTVGHICNFALAERLMDMSAFQNNGVSAVIISLGDLPYNDARLLYFEGNTTMHVFTRL